MYTHIHPNTQEGLHIVPSLKSTVVIGVWNLNPTLIGHTVIQTYHWDHLNSCGSKDHCLYPGSPWTETQPHTSTSAIQLKPLLSSPAVAIFWPGIICGADPHNTMRAMPHENNYQNFIITNVPKIRVPNVLVLSWEIHMCVGCISCSIITEEKRTWFPQLPNAYKTNGINNGNCDKLTHPEKYGFDFVRSNLSNTHINFELLSKL